MTIATPPELDFDIIFAGGKAKRPPLIVQHLVLHLRQAELRRVSLPGVLLQQTHL